MRTADTLEPCMCVTRTRMCGMCAQCMYTTKMCVQQVSVHSPSHTQWLLLRGCELLWVLLKNSQKNSSLHDHLREHLRTSFMFFLISLTETWSTNLLFNNYQMYESMFLGFPRHSCRLILDDAFVWYLILSSGSSFQLCESVCTALPSYSMRVYTSPQYLWNLTYASAMSCLNFISCNSQLNFLRGLLTQTVVLVWVFCMCFSSLWFLVWPIATLWCNWVEVPHLQFWSWLPKNCAKCWNSYSPKIFRSVTTGLFEA